LGTSIQNFEVTEEMADAVSVYVDYCRAISNHTGYVAVEEKFNLGSLNPPAPMYGTGDYVSFKFMSGVLEIVDLKFGRGVVVEVQDNPQLAYYALGAVLAMEQKYPKHVIRTVRMTIVQPRIEHTDGLVRTAVMNRIELLDFTAELMEAARATVEPDAPRQCGSWCRWCRASAICPEKMAESLAVAQMEFDAPMSPPDPTTLSPEELEWILERIPDLEDWARSVRQHATEVLEHGGEVPGFKLVAKRAYRRWSSTGELMEWAEGIGLGFDDLHENKLKSPAQLEKLVGKKKIPEELVKKESSGVTLVPEHDKRPAVTGGTEFPLLPNPAESGE
jgi:hypothetical protein